jgi:hypothetical protein
MRALEGTGPAVSEETKSSAGREASGPAESRRGLPKVSSGVNIAAIYVEAKDGQIAQKETEFKQALDPVQGFDLSKINSHYMHRRRLRREKMVLRYGELINLTARDQQNAYMPDVLCYARYSLMETAIIATNMSDGNRRFYLDLSQLLPTFR